jgi:membrane-associated phospholipid phosphatase
MLETLSQIDKALFLFINVKLANPFTDLIMPILTDDWNLRIVYALAMGMIIWKGDRRLRWLVLFSCLTLALTDQISSMWLKEWIGRLRPCHTLPILDIHLLVPCGSGKSMPSSHAANCFGQALLFGLTYARVRWPLLIFAFLVSISRVFVGVHYPFDVLAGIGVGIVVGVAVYYAWSRLPIAKTDYAPAKKIPPSDSRGDINL